MAFCPPSRTFDRINSSEKMRFKRTTPSSRNLDRQKDEALVSGRQVSSDRSYLSHMAGEEKLSASLRQVPAHHDEVGPHPVLGLLANGLKCTSTLSVRIARRGFEFA
jgi:hypothetical protein